MLEFKEIKTTDKLWVDELMSYSDYRGCEYSFGNNFIWRNVYDFKICRYKDFFLLKNNKGYFFPAGRGDRAEVIEMLKKQVEDEGRQLFFTTMNKDSKDWLEKNYGDKIEINTNRDLYDYIYDYYDLSVLAGKKYHSKRNHINRFKESNWSYERISEGNIEDCIKMSEKWCLLNESGDEDDKDCCAVNIGLENYFKLGFSGGLLRIDGSVHAFTFGERLNSDTFVVHVEKAFTEVQGTYPTINFEFLNHDCTGYSYVNREEDMGIENLRKSKLSYRPIFFEEKFTALFK